MSTKRGHYGSKRHYIDQEDDDLDMDHDQTDASFNDSDSENDNDEDLDYSCNNESDESSLTSIVAHYINEIAARSSEGSSSEDDDDMEEDDEPIIPIKSKDSLPIIRDSLLTLTTGSPGETNPAQQSRSICPEITYMYDGFYVHKMPQVERLYLAPPRAPPTAPVVQKPLPCPTPPPKIPKVSPIIKEPLTTDEITIQLNNYTKHILNFNGRRRRIKFNEIIYVLGFLKKEDPTVIRGLIAHYLDETFRLKLFEPGTPLSQRTPGKSIIAKRVATVARSCE